MVGHPLGPDHGQALPLGELLPGLFPMIFVGPCSPWPRHGSGRRRIPHRCGSGTAILSLGIAGIAVGMGAMFPIKVDNAAGGLVPRGAVHGAQPDLGLRGDWDRGLPGASCHRPSKSRPPSSGSVWACFSAATLLCLALLRTAARRRAATLES